MINYEISNNSKFTYSTDSEVPIKVLIKVFYEIDNSLLYSTEMIISKNVSFFTCLADEWNNKKVFISNANEEISFDMKGMCGKLSEYQKIKLDRYLKKIYFENRTELCDIMDNNKSDKASNRHNYTRFYSQIFEKMRFDEINIFELGLGTNNINLISNMGSEGSPGASIFGWSEYFKNGYIFGADIDIDCLFNTDNIKTFYCDQTKPWIIRQMWDNKNLDFKFDIIIEDGLHTFDANVTFFENSYHKLKDNGIYIIEDISYNEIVKWIDKLNEYETKFPQFSFEILHIDCVYNKLDNNLIKITYKKL